MATLSREDLLFAAAALLLLTTAVYRASTSPIWSPRDEIAHFDFIDQLASLRYPQPSDQISEHTARLCREDFAWRKPSGYDGSIASMGIAGWSYESQNPPLYYGLLAALHRALRATGISATAQVLWLRLLGVACFALGAFLLLPLCAELQRSFGVPTVYGRWLCLISLGTQHLYVTSLGNDVLTLPLASASYLFLLRFWRSASIRDLSGLTATSAAASITKLTNVPLLALPFLAVAAARTRAPARYSSRIWGLPALALLPFAAFLGWNLWRSGRLLGSAEAREVFARFVEPLQPTSRFLGILTADAFNLQSFGIGLRPEIQVGLGILLLAGAFQSLVWLRRGTRCREAALHLAAVAVVGLTVAAALFLNARIPGVHWHVFRHYYAVLPIWLFAFLALPLRLSAGRQPLPLPSLRGDSRNAVGKER